MANLFQHQDAQVQREFESVNAPVLQREQVISTVADGTQPFPCTSTTVNTNLNADMVDGQHGGGYLCKYYSTTFTITGGGGDVTVEVPFDWTGGYMVLHLSTLAVDWQGANVGGVKKTFWSSYDALTAAGYTGNQLLTNQNGVLIVADKGFANYGAPVSATTTSITFNDTGTTVYCKLFVWA